MTSVALPSTDLTVSRICLGSAELGLRNTEREAHALLDHFVRSGGMFLDTARVYSDWVEGEIGRTERIIGDWLSSRTDRSRVIVATKGGHPPLSDMRHSRLTRGEIEHDITLSLSALRLPAIDLYYLHRDDASLPVGPIIDALEDFARQGLIRFYACSNWKPSRIREAAEYARAHRCHGFVANQLMWNIGVYAMNPPADATLVRFDAETEHLHRSTGMAAVPFSSQAEGFFDKATSGGERAAKASKRPYWTQPNLRLAEEMKAVAREHGLSLSGLALSYLLSQDFLVVPIVGCHSISQLDDSLRAVETRLDAATMARLESVVGYRSARP
jgi:aryl-alcohol dehydrogenase-like predicted oxidoreductase